MSQLVGRVMADENGERGGVMVNIASTVGVAEPLAGCAAYAASKAGVLGFGRECAREFAAYAIRVYTLTPPEPVPETAVVQEVLSLCAQP